jgi:hypothetical protein
VQAFAGPSCETNLAAPNRMTQSGNIARQEPGAASKQNRVLRRVVP